MGAWGRGLLDNDNALDGLGYLIDTIRRDIIGATDPRRAAAAVGVLLQLSPYDFSGENEGSAALVAALRKVSFRPLPPKARDVLAEVMSGGFALAGRPAQLPDRVAALLHEQGRTQSGFGERQEVLLGGPGAAAYVQEICNRCLGMIAEDFEKMEIWNDLSREAMSMGALGALLILEPLDLPKLKLATWRKLASAALAEIEREESDENEFDRDYYWAVDGGLEVLLSRAS